MAGASPDLLQRVPLFSDLTRKDLERIGSSMKERRFEPDDTLTVEGRGGVGFFVIEDGYARVSVHDEERGRLGPGDYFGEIALISEGSRTATITAETPIKAWGMTMWDFRPLVEGNAEISWKMLQAMAKQLHAAESRAAGAA
ncbi:MAG TPA: cyclic nucleotide-binding domain-containing protein [Gaiellaceae bacterium]|nr:cyclic nucleotide-binding domain-containing protein [Gaiellaceae bacterium]